MKQNQLKPDFIEEILNNISKNESFKEIGFITISKQNKNVQLKDKTNIQFRMQNKDIEYEIIQQFISPIEIESKWIPDLIKHSKNLMQGDCDIKVVSNELHAVCKEKFFTDINNDSDSVVDTILTLYQDSKKENKRVLNLVNNIDYQQEYNEDNK